MRKKSSCVAGNSQYAFASKRLLRKADKNNNALLTNIQVRYIFSLLSIRKLLKEEDYVSHPSFRLKRAYLAMRRCMEETLQPFGLTAAQFDVLQQLLHENGLEHRVLQERLFITSPTLTNIVDGMVERGLVERRMSHEDARVKRLYLTEKAHDLHTQLGELGQQFVGAMFAGFSRNEIGLFLDWLDRLTHNFEDRCSS